jgi:integrase
MPRVINRLTAVAVTNTKAKGLYPDGGGLYLRVTSTGSKSWIFRFTRGGVTHDMGLGPVSSISLARARELAVEAGRQRLEGLDPIKAREAERAAARRLEAGAATFRYCAEQFIASREPGWRNPKQAKLWRSTLETYAYPMLGDLPVSAIDTGLIMRVLEPIWAKKPETATRVRSRMEAILDWAKVRGFRAGENAARWRGHLDHLLPARSKVRRVRHHPALPYAEIPAFMQALRSRSGIAPRALEFVILTAGRTSEVLRAVWGEIDFGARMWVIPADRMKGDKEHRVPLCDRTITILKDMQEIRQSEFLFQGFNFQRQFVEEVEPLQAARAILTARRQVLILALEAGQDAVPDRGEPHGERAVLSQAATAPKKHGKGGGNAGVAGRARGSLRDHADKSGRSKDTINRDLKRHNALGDAILATVAGTELARGVYLDRLIAIPERDRQEKIDRVRSGELPEDVLPPKAGPGTAAGPAAERCAWTALMNPLARGCESATQRVPAALAVSSSQS